jgi:tRNA-2-methylthio-N6-dimethylallyladenosine synthase
MLTTAGWIETAEESEADLILFNTCCVREHAEERLISRVQALSGVRRAHPELLIAVGGCLAQKEREHLADLLPLVDIVFGPNDIPRLLDLLDRAPTAKTVFGDFVEKGSFFGEEADGIVLERPFSAFVNIIRGCSNFCAYCIVPMVRGPEVSRPAGEIVAFVSDLVRQGVSEVTVLGQNVNAYGKDLGREEGFPELLEALNEIPGLRRIRFLTSHPRDFTCAAIDRLSRLSKVCEQFHLPVQAGSDRILALMNRGYTRDAYLALVDHVRQAIPGACLTTDIICGFPGETEEEFEQTLDLVERVRYESAYTYFYSPRAGTRAADFPDLLPVEVRKARLSRLIEAQNRISLEESMKCIGWEFEILVEEVSTRTPGHVYGKTRSGRVVDFAAPPTAIGSYIPVVIERARNWTLSGRRID